MRPLHINVLDKKATYVSRDGDIVCGNSDYVIEFAFDAEWAAHDEKIARFIWDGHYKDVTFTGTTCPVPIITNTTVVEIGVYAGELSTTTPAMIGCQKSILCTSAPQGGVPFIKGDKGDPGEGIPEITETDNGKVLTAENGKAVWKDRDIIYDCTVTTVRDPDHGHRFTCTLENFPELVEGATYKVYYDGELYECVYEDKAKGIPEKEESGETVWCLGNAWYVMPPYVENTGVPFCVYVEETGTILFSRGDGEHTLAIYETKTTALPTMTMPNIFIRYSANADGTDFTEEWTEGQKYIGVATAVTAPTDKSDYEWSYFAGNDIFIRYSANADGANFTETWNTSQMYIGIAVAKTAPTDKSGYKWSLFAPDITTITAETLPNKCITYDHLDDQLKKCVNPIANLIKNGNGKNGTDGWNNSSGSTVEAIDGGVKYTQAAIATAYWEPTYCVITDMNAISAGDILFQYADMMADGAPTDIRLAIESRNQYFVRVYNPVANEWYKMYRRHTVLESQISDGALKPMLFAQWNSVAERSGCVYVKNAMIINLTKTYGAGNEPSDEEMLALIESQGGYIDGTLNLFDAKAMMERQDNIEGRVADLENGMSEGDDDNDSVTVPSRLVKNHSYYVSGRTATGDGSKATLNTWEYFTFTEGHIYYARCTISVDSDSEFIVRWGTSADSNGFTTINAEANKIYPVSLCFSAPSAASWNWTVVFASAEEAKNKTVVFDNFVLFDLTEEFGNGYEPPAVNMDALVNNIDVKTEYVDLMNGGVVGDVCARRLRGTTESLYSDDQNGVPYVETMPDGNIMISSVPNASWDKWDQAQYSYGMTMRRHVPIYNYVHGVLETDAMFSVQALYGRWTENASNVGAHPYGGHVFEAWNAPRTYRYTVLIGKNAETESCAFTFSPLSGGGGTFGTLRLGSDITGEGLLVGKNFAEMGGDFAVNGKLNVKKRTIASSTAEGTAGEICFDSNYVYVCVATNTWKRFTLETW